MNSTLHKSTGQNSRNVAHVIIQIFKFYTLRDYIEQDFVAEKLSKIYSILFECIAAHRMTTKTP